MEFIQLSSLQDLLQHLIPLFLFYLIVKIAINKKSQKVMLIWRRREADIFKDWYLADKEKVEEEIIYQLRKEVCKTWVLVIVVLINIFGFPYVFNIITFSTMPWFGWLLSVIIVVMLINSRGNKIEKEGIPVNSIVHHAKISNNLNIDVVHNRVKIIHPYLFIKSYQRLLLIPDEITKAIRESGIVIDGQKLVEILTQEEDWLLKDMNTALLGRVPSQYIKYDENYNNQILRTLISYMTSTLPISLRYRSMELARELQSTSFKKSIHGYTIQPDAFQDVQLIEKLIRE